MTAMETTVDTILCMRRQEDTVYRHRNWLHGNSSHSCRTPQHWDAVDQECRQKIATWCFQVAEICQFQHETIEISMSLLDRYMLTPQGRVTRRDRTEYQLASMAALYTSVKIHEPAAMDPQLVSKLSRGAFSADEITDMEAHMLQAMDWRLNPPTAHSFVRELMQLVPFKAVNQEIRKSIDQLCSYQIDLAVVDDQFLTVSASTIAYAAINNALETLALDEKVIGFIRHIFSQALALGGDSNLVSKVQRALYHAILRNPQDEDEEMAPATPQGNGKSVVKTQQSPRSVAS